MQTKCADECIVYACSAPPSTIEFDVICQLPRDNAHHFMSRESQRILRWMDL